ncbi:MAG: hypothetical protein U9Q81_14865 [Pseudomonadota bacterium]|nr:hypothetical protein [Pseudomonadota bacterium]
MYPNISKFCARETLFVLLVWFLAVGASGAIAAAQQERTQVINEHLESDEIHPFDLVGLDPGDTLYALVEPVSGSLEPILALADPQTDLAELEEAYIHDVLEMIEQGREFQVLFPTFADRWFLTWNQGGGPQGALEYKVTGSGDYHLLLIGSYHKVLDRSLPSFGSYRLQVGLNAPQALSKDAPLAGKPFVSPSRDLRKRVQEHREILTTDQESLNLPLQTIDAGQTLYVYVETSEDELRPSVKLREYGSRLINFDNLDGEKRVATFEHRFDQADQNALLQVEFPSGLGESDGAGVRVLLGINTPEVLEGEAEERGRPVILEPLKVSVAIRVDQISSIDQKAENFSVVGSLIIDWVDPALAFNPATCRCSQKIFKRSNFRELAGERGMRQSGFIFFNQQGKRWIQEEDFFIWPDGSVRYFERFSVTLQAPDFDFRRFPFDTQTFYIRVVSLRGAQDVVFEPNAELNHVSDKLGEEEWLIKDWGVHVGFIELGDALHSELVFRLSAHRHINYYIVRIFLPLILLITVAWVTFFPYHYPYLSGVGVDSCWTH